MSKVRKPFHLSQIPDHFVRFDTAAQGLNGTQQSNARTNIGAEGSISSGTTSQYLRGDKTWQTLNTTAVSEGTNLYYTDVRVRAALLTGYAVGSNTALAATDSILAAMGKIQAQLNNKQASGSYANASHTHIIGDVTGLQSALDGKQPAGSYVQTAGDTMTGNLSFGTTVRQMLNLWSTTYGIGIQSSTQYYRTDGGYAWFRGGVHSNTQNDPGTGGSIAMLLDNASNLTVYGTIRRNGGTASQFLKADGSVDSTSYQPAGSYAATSHTHAATDITSGTMATARLGSGTANSTVFLRGDSTWAQVAWSNLSGVPATFTPSAHTHPWADINGFSNGTSGSLRLSTGTGYADIGSQNTSWFHFITDRPNFFFGQGIHVNGEIRVYASNTYLTSTAGFINNNQIWHAGNFTPGSYVTSVSSGTGLTGGPITTSGTLSFDTSWGDARYSLAAHTHSRLYGNWTDNLNSFSGTYGDFFYHYFPSSATNKPVTVNNANAVLTMFSHMDSYGKQIAFADNEDLYIRRIANGGYGTWRRLWHDGLFNPGTGIVVRQSGGGFISRSITAGEGITVTDGNGDAQNPIVALSNTFLVDRTFLNKGVKTVADWDWNPSTTQFNITQSPFGWNSSFYGVRNAIHWETFGNLTRSSGTGTFQFGFKFGASTYTLFSDSVSFSGTVDYAVSAKVYIISATAVKAVMRITFRSSQSIGFEWVKYSQITHAFNSTFDVNVFFQFSTVGLTNFKEQATGVYTY